MKHILSIYVNDRPGVLARVAGLFSRRGHNIDDVFGGPAQVPDVYCITITVKGNDTRINQITKQVEKLVDVIKIIDHTPEDGLNESDAIEIKRMVYNAHTYGRRKNNGDDNVL